MWVAALAAWLLAAAPVSARMPPPGATVFVHSAMSGELGGGRLTLRGAGRRVTWAHESGRTGVLRVERMHRLVFSIGRPTATGTLHVAGHHGGDELTFRLTRPRYYSATRRTVSYEVTQLNHASLPGRAARAAAGTQQFGAAALSIVGAPQVGSMQAGNTCYECDPFGSGNLGVQQLDLLCAPNGDKSIDVSGVRPDGSMSMAHADAPVYTNPYTGDFVCSNQGP